VQPGSPAKYRSASARVSLISSSSHAEPISSRALTFPASATTSATVRTSRSAMTSGISAQPAIPFAAS